MFFFVFGLCFGFAWLYVTPGPYWRGTRAKMFPQGSYQGHGLWYSYKTCGGKVGIAAGAGWQGGGEAGRLRDVENQLPLQSTETVIGS